MKVRITATGEVRQLDKQTATRLLNEGKAEPVARHPSQTNDGRRTGAETR